MYPASDSIRQALAADTANQLKEVGIGSEDRVLAGMTPMTAPRQTAYVGLGCPYAYGALQYLPYHEGYRPGGVFTYANDSVDRYMDEALASGNLEDSTTSCGRRPSGTGPRE